VVTVSPRVVAGSNVSDREGRVQDCNSKEEREIKGNSNIVRNGDNKTETTRQHPVTTHQQSESVTDTLTDNSINAAPEEKPIDEPLLDVKQEMAPQSAVSVGERKVSQAAKAMEKINAAQQALKQQQNVAPSAKQGLEGIVHVTPKTPLSHAAGTPGLGGPAPHIPPPSSPKEESGPKLATVRRAAEKFERHTAVLNSKSVSDLTFSPNIRGRSKSIGDALRTRFVEDQVPDKKGGPLPWAGRSPPTVKRKEGMRGYALQMSKSSDSITAAKLLAKARAENSYFGQHRINQNLSKSVERQIDVYTKTKDEIRKILNLAKAGSVTDRVALFTRLKDYEAEPVDPEQKAEAIRMEIVNARAEAQAKQQDTVSDTEIEFQSPIESKVRPLKIPLNIKENLSQPGSPATTLRINQSATSQDSPKKERRLSIEDLPSIKSKIQSYNTGVEDTTAPDETKDEFTTKPKPILKSDKERSRSPRKTPKAPKLLSDHYLAPNQTMQIYAQSATDMSATEDESEISRRETGKKVSVVMDDSFEPGPTLLQVPTKPLAEARPGIMKSKSFASPGQYEGSIEESSGKKLQMMAFFGQGAATQQKTVRISEKPPAKSASINSINDEAMDDEEDLTDIDAEFESLLNKTFEMESRRLAQREEPQHGRRHSEKVGVCAPAHTGTAGSSRGDHSLRRSSSYGQCIGGSRHARDVSDSVGMQPVTGHRHSHTQGYTGLATEAGGTQPRRETGGTPSPTQSEYDTCDPWEDY